MYHSERFAFDGDLHVAAKYFICVICSLNDFSCWYSAG